MSWSRAFDEPVTLPDGRKLRTLKDAGRYIAELPKAEQAKQQWQTAAHELMIAAERGGFLMLAEVAMRQAIHAERPAAPEPRRKRTKKYKVIR